MVVLVGDNDSVVAVAANASGPIELTVLFSTDAKLVVKDPLRCEDLDAVVGAIGDEDKAFPGTANTPGPAELAVVLTLHAESKNGRADVAVAAACANFQPGQKKTAVALAKLMKFTKLFKE